MPDLIKKNYGMHIMWLYIATIASYDLFRCLYDGESFLSTELNPLVKAIYHSLGDDLMGFCIIKFIGTCICMLALLGMKDWILAPTIYITMSVIQTLVLMSYCPAINPL